MLTNRIAIEYTCTVLEYNVSHGKNLLQKQLTTSKYNDMYMTDITPQIHMQYCVQHITTKNFIL